MSGSAREYVGLYGCGFSAVLIVFTVTIGVSLSIARRGVDNIQEVTARGEASQILAHECRHEVRPSIGLLDRGHVWREHEVRSLPQRGGRLGWQAARMPRATSVRPANSRDTSHGRPTPL